MAGADSLLRAASTFPGIPSIFRRKPSQIGDIELIKSGRRGGVQEALPFVVENIFAVIGTVEQRRTVVFERAEIFDRLREEVVCIVDRIVVGIDEFLDVLSVDGHVIVRQEAGEFTGVSLVIGEMRAVTVQDDEQVVFRIFGDNLFHRFQQLHIVTWLRKVHQAVCILGQLVDHGSLGALVGKKPGFEPSLLEECRKPLATV